MKKSEVNDRNTGHNDMNNDDAQVACIVADATTSINANAKNEAKIGEVVARAVTASGGTSSDLTTITEDLAKLVPYGARRLRSFYRRHLRTNLIETAASGTYPLFVGDPDAHIVHIGGLVDGMIGNSLMLGINPIDAVKPLASRLGEVGAAVSPTALLRCRSAHVVAKLAGEELAKFIPGQYPATVLPAFMRLVKGQMPWVAKNMIIEAAKEVVRRQPKGKRQVDAILADVLAKEGRKAPKPFVPFAFWHIPAKPTKTVKPVRDSPGMPPTNANKAA